MRIKTAKSEARAPFKIFAFMFSATNCASSSSSLPTYITGLSPASLSVQRVFFLRISLFLITKFATFKMFLVER